MTKRKSNKKSPRWPTYIWVYRIKDVFGEDLQAYENLNDLRDEIGDNAVNVARYVFNRKAQVKIGVVEE